jgi:hypothetical protein
MAFTKNGKIKKGKIIDIIIINNHVLFIIFITLLLGLLLSLLLEHNALCSIFQNFQIRFEFTRRKATVVISEKFLAEFRPAVMNAVKIRNRIGR